MKLYGRNNGIKSMRRVIIAVLVIVVIAAAVNYLRGRDSVVVVQKKQDSAVCGNGLCESEEAKQGCADCPEDRALADGDLLFRSGFESGVVLDAPRVGGGEWEQVLYGGDQGYAWEDLLSRGSPTNRFTYLVSSEHASSELNDYALTRIDTVSGRSNESTHALFMEMKEEDPLTFEKTRNQYGIYPPSTLRQAYMRYWMKLQPDLEIVLPEGELRSRQIMEWKETGQPRSDFRWNINIKRSPGRKDLIWWTDAQFGDLARSPHAWQCVSSGVPVPIDEWFLFEVFWKTDQTNGRVWAAVNGQIIVDYRGRTQKDSGLFVWWPFKVYAGAQLEEKFAATPGFASVYQWVDDVEVYDNIPESSLALISEDHATCETFPEPF